MAKLPAFCERCGNDFTFNNLIHSGSEAKITLNLSNNLVICPNCNYIKAKIIDGTYEILGDVLKILKGSDVTISSLKKLAEILEKVEKKQSNADEVAEEIKTEVPELSKISDILPQKRSELYTIVGWILSAIAVVISFLTYQETIRKNEQKPSPSNIYINTTINNQIFNNSIKTNKAIKKNKIMPKKTKIGVNQPCHCGSGKKLKKCHQT